MSSEDGKISERFFELSQEIKGDVIVQKALKQHEDIAGINPSSVNTIRIISLISEEGVKIYSAILRIGTSDAKVDNASVGGITCGIDLDTGKLKEYAYYVYYVDGGRCDRHPTSNVVFKGRQIPSFEKAKQLVYDAHIMTPQFRLISWDIAIREDGEPVLVEANLRTGGIDFHQLCNGPLFGDDTTKILDEVFGKK